MKTIEYKGFLAQIDFDEEDQIFTGEVIGIDDVVCFHAEGAKEIIPTFHQMIDGYLKDCEEDGIAPQKSFSGKFVLRVPPKLHAKMAKCAQEAKKSLNAWVAEQLERILKISAA